MISSINVIVTSSFAPFFHPYLSNLHTELLNEHCCVDWCVQCDTMGFQFLQNIPRCATRTNERLRARWQELMTERCWKLTASIWTLYKLFASTTATSQPEQHRYVNQKWTIYDLRTIMCSVHQEEYNSWNGWRCATFKLRRTWRQYFEDARVRYLSLLLVCICQPL